MPFVAKLRSTGERVDITSLANPRQALKAQEIECQLCGAPMIVCAGMIVRAHFRHRTECESDYASHPESQEHMLGKRKIAERLRTEVEEYTDAAIEYEVPIPEVKRIADVMAIFPNGWRVAHECQLASITTEKLNERTQDYFRAGVDVVWWLGKSAATPANIRWCIEYQGFCIQLYFTDPEGYLPESA